MSNGVARRLARTLTTAALIATSSLYVLVSGSPASAATAPEPIALGVARATDNRVLQIGGDGVSNSSPIVVAPYQQGTTLAPRQRWRLERRASGSGIPDYTYRIINPASGKCLNAAGATATNGAALILYTCATAANSYWYVPGDPGPDGVRLTSLRDNRCVNIPGAATGNNVALKVWNCSADDAAAWNQMWTPRTGQDRSCSIRSRDWQGFTRLCVRPAAAVRAVMASWPHHPAGLSWRDPEDYILSNEMRSYLGATFSGSTAGLQFGWRARRSDTPTGSMTYTSYWLTNPSTGQGYFEVPATDPWGGPNGSRVADGTQHTYLAVAADDAAGWDLYFDYNLVGRVTSPINARANSVELGSVTRYLNATGFTAPYDFRTQVMDTNGVWRQPAETETTTANPKTCDRFPVWDDFSGGEGLNREPWCWTNTRTFTGTPAVLDRYTVDKSAVTSLAAAPQTLPTSVPKQASIVNGVDQAALAACLRRDATTCLDEVPGLAACVAAHKSCNHTRTVRSAAPASPRTARDLTTTAMAALDADPAKGSVSGRMMTVEQATERLPALATQQQTPADQQVYVVTGTQRVHGFGERATTVFNGWSAALEPRTGQVLYAHLGNAG
jgi:hypothetical protein